MKKKVTLLFAVLALTVGSVKAQWFDFTNNVRASIGMNLGVVGYHLLPNEMVLNTEFADFGWGGFITAGGVYIDYIYQNPQHRYSSQVGVADWEDHTALTINVGYQIPVLPWLFVTPLVGYSNETTGITKANEISAQDSSIVHKYERQTIDNHFNYGAGVTFRLFKTVEIGAMATSHAVYGNIGLSLGL